MFPVAWHQSLRDLLLFISLQGGNTYMLDVPCVFVLHDASLALFQNLGHKGRNERLISEFGDWGEECLEVEDDGARQRQAAQRLPVDSQVAAVERQVGRLKVAVFLVGIVRRHVERLVDFEAPRAALNGPVTWHPGEEPVDIGF